MVARVASVEAERMQNQELARPQLWARGKSQPFSLIGRRKYRADTRSRKAKQLKKQLVAAKEHWPGSPEALGVASEPWTSHLTCGRLSFWEINNTAL